MEPIQLKHELKHLSIEARYQTKLQFFRLYEKYGSVAKCAGDLGIASDTATVWEQREKELLRMIVDKTPLQYKFKFALGNAKTVIHDSTSKKVVLIVDNLRIHQAKIVRAWAARHRDEIKIFYLPAYSPELNPDELVNGDLKPGVGQREPAANKEELRMQIVQHMEETKAIREK